MKLRSRLLIAPLLALFMTLAVAATVHAGTDVSLQINFGTAPHWVGVPGTQVRVIRQQDRTDYDMFQFRRNYYAYNHMNHRWYKSRRGRGQFTLIDDRSVPRELRRIPRNHWRNYPTAWEDSRERGSYGSSATLQVTFGTAPRWSGIYGTRVEMVSAAGRPDYDVFRFGGNYYAYSSNRWYSSPRESGQFTMIDDRSVPSEFSKVPRKHWRNFPAAWGNQNDNGPGNSNGRGKSKGR